MTFSMDYFYSIVNASRYFVPRREDNIGGSATISLAQAQNIISKAPAPSHNKARNARRPHAHYDREDHFAETRQGLLPLPGIPPPSNGPPPVLWAYPSNTFDYANQNRFGVPKGGVGVDAGPFRIITDKDKNILGMVFHPTGDLVNFARAQPWQHHLAACSIFYLDIIYMALLLIPAYYLLQIFVATVH
ncbi:hypothetical protein EsH8_VIII_000904 [Colletotrichum jinshuiense]